jgi:hypothetical protein
MKFNELVEKLQAAVVVSNEEAEIASVYTGDLLSDVMGHCGESSVLITVQNHLNAIAVCTLAGVEVVVICHSRTVPDDMREAAEREGVGIVTTPMSQFAASVALSSLQPSSK